MANIPNCAPLDITETLRCWEDWWDGKSSKALLAAISPRPGELAWKNSIRPWMDPRNVSKWSVWMHEFLFTHAVEQTFRTGDDVFLDDACALLARYYESTIYHGEAYPFLHPTLGASCLPVFLTGHTQFAGDTIWLELEEKMELQAVIDLLDGPLHPYTEVAFEGFRRLAKVVQPHCVMAELDMGTGLDVLSALRGPQNLAFDLLDNPELVHTALEKIYKLWERMKARYDAIIVPGNHNASSCVMRYLSSRPMHLAYCDFSVMISTEMFSEFVVPHLTREASSYPDRTVWHMDGPGQIRHTKAICTVPGMRAVQWVYGAGNPPSLSERWYPLYREILDLGCRVCLQGVGYEPDALAKFFKVFPAREFMVPGWIDDPRQAADLLVQRETW